MVNLEDDTEDMNPTPWLVGRNHSNEPKKKGKMEVGSMARIVDSTKRDT